MIHHIVVVCDHNGRTIRLWGWGGGGGMGFLMVFFQTNVIIILSQKFVDDLNVQQICVYMLWIDYNLVFY